MVYLFHFFLYFVSFVGLDFFLGSTKGKYYLVHFINNMYLVYLTYNDVINSWTNLNNVLDYPTNYEAATLTFALHFYHIAVYFNKLRFDDWLHHILMIFVALPLAVVCKSGSLMGNSLFFLTGLPGGIDYLLLFFVRNNLINPIIEKRINNYINLWLRAPGCISHATLAMASYFILKNQYTQYEFYTCVITSLIIFWNGVYFMNQVVTNYTIQSLKN